MTYLLIGDRDDRTSQRDYLETLTESQLHIKVSFNPCRNSSVVSINCSDRLPTKLMMECDHCDLVALARVHNMIRSVINRRMDEVTHTYVPNVIIQTLSIPLTPTMPRTSYSLGSLLRFTFIIAA